jgi:hypothetical protein
MPVCLVIVFFNDAPGAAVFKAATRTEFGFSLWEDDGRRFF